MKSPLFKKHIYLFLSLLFFFLSLAFWYFFIINPGKSNDELTVQTISKKINIELNGLSEEGDKIIDDIKRKGKVSFTSLPSRGLKHPYFIFRNKELVYWSNNSFAPSYEILKGNNDFRFLQLRNGKYLVHKKTLHNADEHYEIFLFLSLASEYSVQNEYISSRLNDDIFSNFPFKIYNIQSKHLNNVFTKNGEFLFSIEVPKDNNYRNEGQMLILILLIAFGIISLVLYLFRWVNKLKIDNREGTAMLLLGSSLFTIRVMMLLLNYPFGIYEYDLFNSKFFASSVFSPSLGDVLLNAIAIVLFSWFVLRSYAQARIFKLMVKAEVKWKKIFSVMMAFLSFYTLYLVFNTLGVLSNHSQWSMDITLNIDFNKFRIISILIFISTFVVYFIFSHVIFRLFIGLNADSFRKNHINFIIGTIAFIGFSLLIRENLWVVIIINFIYYLIVFNLRLYRTLSAIKYSTYVYFLLCGLVCAATCSYSVYRQNRNESIFDKQHFANDLIFKNDVFGEFLLNEASIKLRKDVFIQSRLLTPLSTKELIEYKIKRAFLPNYFDKYDVVISVFDSEGNVFEQNSDFANYFEAEQKYRKVKFRTGFPQIYFIRDHEKGAKKYICFNEIYLNEGIIGYVIIELKHKKVVPHSVYPELLVNNFSEKPHESQDYNYSVYANGKFLYSFGSYNYESNFNPSFLNNEDLYKDGILRDGYHHIGLKASDGKRIIVSSEEYYFKRIFSNFSFFYLILILFTLLFIIVFALNFTAQKLSTTYATRIRIYLNIAFFLPLLIVSITTLGIISASYTDSLNNSFIKKAEGITLNIKETLLDFKNESRIRNTENILMEIGKYTESDINIYNNRGRLVYTNQPMIYELGFHSKLINPKAYASMVENTANTSMIPERIGKLKYNSVYVPIRSEEQNRLLGIISMPFFESKHELDKQIIEVLTTIVNIFVSIFMLFVILSYFASRMLTVPLKMITQKLKKTTLDKNEPIEWRGKDEIGLLVNEYNSMLLKLEEHRLALSKSEKESAWREMAKQVAHEIKNPLTPMKLTIQHLQRSLDTKDQELPEKTKKALNVLLDQVNNLSEIATSFSMFAKMPIPKNQRFEIASVLVKTAALHNNNKSVDVQTNIESGHFYVMGDEQLMSGIFTNLILNGVQSVPNGAKAEIFIKLKKSDTMVFIQVKDNGSGIPESIREKVFLPNFSTKYSGSGIGLAVAKRGVEHAGGRIWFETAEGNGTSFFIEIPLSD